MPRKNQGGPTDNVLELLKPHVFLSSRYRLLNSPEIWFYRFQLENAQKKTHLVDMFQLENAIFFTTPLETAISGSHLFFSALLRRVVSPHPNQCPPTDRPPPLSAQRKGPSFFVQSQADWQEKNSWFSAIRWLSHRLTYLNWLRRSLPKKETKRNKSFSIAGGLANWKMTKRKRRVSRFKCRSWMGNGSS